jgi:hypothetical protein
VWTDEETGNEVATAKTYGLVDGLAIELARSLDKVAVPLHEYIVNNKGYIDYKQTC